MWKIGIAVAAVALGYFLFKDKSNLPSEILPEYTQGNLSSQSVVGGKCSTDKCLVIYVAPWCPACQRMKSTITRLLDAVETNGHSVTLVVGMDKEAELIRHGASYARRVVLDVKGDFQKRAKIKGVPYFAVTNSKGEIVNEISGGTPSVVEMRSRLKI
jgi:thiol-disulfide isomerase/thioredoxin